MICVVSKTTRSRARRCTHWLLSSIVASLLLSAQASACTNIRNTYSGSTQAVDTTAYGPFTIGSTCMNTLIELTVKASGAGSPPDMYIDELTNVGWKKVSGPTTTSTSYLKVGELGTFRIRQGGGSGTAPLYTGTVTYGH